MEIEKLLSCIEGAGDFKNLKYNTKVNHNGKLVGYVCGMSFYVLDLEFAKHLMNEASKERFKTSHRLGKKIGTKIVYRKPEYRFIRFEGLVWFDGQEKEEDVFEIKIEKSSYDYKNKIPKIFEIISLLSSL